ncbi:DUF1449 domain-containing protein [Thalassotalea ganghwensis]
MTYVLEVSSHFPSLIYSVLLGVVIVYWLVGLFGVVDLDLSGDMEVDLDADAATSVSGLTGLFLTFGLTGIPFTLVISILILVCWLISFYSQHYILALLPDGWLYYLFGTVSGLVVFIISLPITALIIRPLKGMFKSAETVTSQHLVGLEAIIATSIVNADFGQARISHNGAEILVNVRCAPDQILSQGDCAVVVDYLQDQHVYVVAPYQR